MTNDPQDDLMLEWRNYSPGQQKAIYNEFIASGGDLACKEEFQNFIKKKLEIDGYWWKRAGLV